MTTVWFLAWLELRVVLFGQARNVRGIPTKTEEIAMPTEREPIGSERLSVIPDVVYHFFFSSRRRHTRYWRDWSSDVCSSDLRGRGPARRAGRPARRRRAVPPAPGGAPTPEDLAPAGGRAGLLRHGRVVAHPPVVDCPAAPGPSGRRVRGRDRPTGAPLGHRQRPRAHLQGTGRGLPGGGTDRGVAGCRGPRSELLPVGHPHLVPPGRRRRPRRPPRPLRRVRARGPIPMSGGVLVATIGPAGAALTATGSHVTSCSGDGVTVVLLGELHYRADLPVGPGRPDDAERIARVYRRGGRTGLAALEGDFAFLLHDRPSGRVLAVRDPTGGHRLYHEQIGRASCRERV